MIKFIKKQSKLFEVMLLLFLSLTPLLWLKDNQIILGHDSGFRLDPVQHLINLFYSWDPSSNFGTDWSWFKGFIITQLPETLFISLARSFTIGQQLTFIFWFFCIGVSMYIFINSFFKEKDYWFFRIFASTFYMYNFFLLQAWFIAERAKFSLFCALPLGVLFIYKTLTRKYSILKGVILFSLMSFLLNAGGNLTFYGVLLLAYGITFIYLTAVNVRRRGYGAIAHSFKVGILFVVGFLTVNSYWILPQLYSFLNGYSSNLLLSVGGIESIIKWESVITENASFTNLLRLQGMPDWYDNSLHTYSPFFMRNPFLVIFSFIPLFILFLGILYHKKLQIDKKNSKLIILILLFLLFGLFFTAGSHPPLGQIYILFIKFIPGFAIFRSAFYKFGTVLWFSYIFLVGFYISLFLSRLVKRKTVYVFLSVFSLFFLLAYHFPFFNDNFFTWNYPFTTKVKVPSYVNDMSDYINKMPASTRILLLPEFDNQADSYEWGFWGIDSLPRLSTNKSIIVNSANFPEIIGSIYYSISQNEENMFLRLMGSSGINRVLWRDDVLYSDKARTSQDFASIRKNLENFKGVTLEKEIGAWSLYHIDPPYYVSIFYGVDTIVHAQSDISISSIFRKEEDSKKLAILFDKLMKDKNKKILLSSSKKVIGAKCIACGSENFSQTKGGLLMPKLKILPTSPFYYLSFLREQQVQQLHKNNPALRIDADLGYSSKRIVEMGEIANTKVKDKHNSFFVSQAINKYKTLIDDALEQANILPEDEKNEAFMKISIYLNSQFWFLSVQGNLYDYALEDFEELSIFMQEKINSLGSKIWATNFTENKIRYFLNLDKSGIYDLNVRIGDIQIISIAVDGKSLTKFKNLAFDKGMHKIEISYPVAKNLIDSVPVTKSGELRLQFGERVKLPIKNFNPKETYFVNFDYKISQGRPNASIIEKEKNKQRVWNLFLNQNSVWNSFSSIFQPNRNTKSVNFEFYPTGFETAGGTIQIKNLKSISVHVPEVFISRSFEPSMKIESPRMSFSRVNPTMYKVNIENSASPFVLAFGEFYSKGWHAYIAEDFFQTFFIKPIPESQHYTLNSYSNGWLIDKKGRYTIIVEYFPQKVFYAGLVVSGVSFFIITLIYLRRFGKI